jgi:hypothetical protein
VHDGIDIERDVHVTGGASTFELRSTPGGALLSQPAPFDGTASYQGERPPGIPSKWSGNLAVNFPAHAGVRLTGREFTADPQPRTGVRSGRRSNPLAVAEGPGGQDTATHAAGSRLLDVRLNGGFFRVLLS